MKKKYSGPLEDEFFDELDNAYQKMVNDELRTNAAEIRINELQRLILLNEKMLITRDYDHINDDYWDFVYEDNEKMQAEIDEINMKLEKGSL